MKVLFYQDSRDTFKTTTLATLSQESWTFTETDTNDVRVCLQSLGRA